jgi:pimeloyl-ACP methyl ester carboxylesterase
VRSSLPPVARRVFLLAGVVALFGMLAGATYQGVATALERRAFPHPGRLVEVGDHQLHIYCTGDGSPTVVLEAPAASMSTAWSLVQPRIAGTVRVCSYDRAGLGWSEAADPRFDPSRVADELLALLDAAGEQGPFVVVGHGLGATFARTFAGRYVDRTASLVLIDMPGIDGGIGSGPLARVTRATPWLARTGLLRAMRTGATIARGLPETSGGATRAFLYRPDHLSRAAAELAMAKDAVQLAADAQPAAPLVEVSLGDGYRNALASDPLVVDRVVAAIGEAIAAARRAP